MASNTILSLFISQECTVGALKEKFLNTDVEEGVGLFGNKLQKLKDKLKAVDVDCSVIILIKSNMSQEWNDAVYRRYIEDI